MLELVVLWGPSLLPLLLQILVIVLELDDSRLSLRSKWLLCFVLNFSSYLFSDVVDCELGNWALHDELLILGHILRELEKLDSIGLLALGGNL